MREFVEYVTKQLVDQPEHVLVTEELQEDKLVIKVKVAQPDIGKIIGKKGRTAFALRTIASAVGKKHGKKVRLEVED